MKINTTFYRSLIKGIFKGLIIDEMGYHIDDIQFSMSARTKLLNYFMERAWKPKNIKIQSFGFLYKDMKHFRVTGSHDMGSAPIFIEIKTLEIKDSI